MNKIGIIAFAVIVIFLGILVVVSMQGSDSPNGTPTTDSSGRPRATAARSSGRATQAPTRQAAILQAKKRIGDNLAYQDVTMTYRSQFDTVVVFYNTSRPDAQKKVAQYFSDQGVASLTGIKIEYIGNTRDAGEPPPGFYR